MKVVFILPGSGSSGGNRCAVIMANGLIKKGHQVRLLVYEPKMFLRPALRSIWIKACYPRTNDWLPLFKGHIDTFRDLTKCDFEHGEVILAVGLWSCREIAKLSVDGTKKIHYIHGEIPWDTNFMKEAWSENVTKIAVASFLEQRVKDICGHDVFAVIPNGVDTKQYYPAVTEDQRNGIGTIFERAPHKDTETILRLLKKLHTVFPTVPQQVFGPSRRPKEISRRIYVRFPSVDEARDIYSRSLVWIMASRSEGFGIPIIEAMACGCAVVATDCGGPRDIIKDGENGFLAEVGNVDGIVAKVKLLLENDELRLQIVKRGKETVQKFCWETSIAKLERVLQKVDSSHL